MHWQEQLLSWFCVECFWIFFGFVSYLCMGSSCAGTKQWIFWYLEYEKILLGSFPSQHVQSNLPTCTGYTREYSWPVEVHTFPDVILPELTPMAVHNRYRFTWYLSSKLHWCRLCEMSLDIWPVWWNYSRARGFIRTLDWLTSEVTQFFLYFRLHKINDNHLTVSSGKFFILITHKWCSLWDVCKTFMFSQYQNLDWQSWWQTPILHYASWQFAKIATLKRPAKSF